MSILGNSDEIIRILQEQITYLRAELQKANDTNLALMNAHAFRMLHGPNAVPAGPVEPFDPEKSGDPVILKSSTFTPSFTLSQLKSEVRPKED